MTVIIVTLKIVFVQKTQTESSFFLVFYLEAVDKQQVEFSTIFSGKEMLCQISEVFLNVSLHLVETDRQTVI